MENDLIKRFHFNSESILRDLPEEDIQLIKKNTRFIKYKKGQVIFAEGNYPAGVFFVKEGKIKKFKYVDDGREQIIYICSNGELLGYSAILCDEPYPDSSSALVDSELGFVPKDAFLHILSVSPQLNVRLLKNLSHEFGVLINNMVNYSHRTVRERLALMLLILNDKFRDGNGKSQVYISLKREDLAGLVGTAVETLVRILRDFKEEKLITTQGRKIFVLNESRLLHIAHLN